MNDKRLSEGSLLQTTNVVLGLPKQYWQELLQAHHHLRCVEVIRWVSIRAFRTKRKAEIQETRYRDCVVHRQINVKFT